MLNVLISLLGGVVSIVVGGLVLALFVGRNPNESSSAWLRRLWAHYYWVIFALGLSGLLIVRGFITIVEAAP